MRNVLLELIACSAIKQKIQIEKKSPAGQTIPFSVTVRQDRDGDVNRLRSDNLMNICSFSYHCFFGFGGNVDLLCAVLSTGVRLFLL